MRYTYLRPQDHKPSYLSPAAVESTPHLAFWSYEQNITIHHQASATNRITSPKLPSDSTGRPCIAKWRILHPYNLGRLQDICGIFFSPSFFPFLARSKETTLKIRGTRIPCYYCCSTTRPGRGIHCKKCLSGMVFLFFHRGIGIHFVVEGEGGWIHQVRLS